MKKILLISDVQNDFCEGGALAVNEARQIIPVINQLIESGLFDLIVCSKDWHPAGHLSFASSHQEAKLFDVVDINGIKQIMWPDHCVQGTYGAEFHPDLKLNSDCRIITKGSDREIDSYSAFFDNERQSETQLRALLEELGYHPENTSFVTCGLALDYCVAYTAMDAKLLGYDTSIVLDGCRPVNNDPKVVTQLLRSFTEKGIDVVSSSQILQESARQYCPRQEHAHAIGVNF